MFSDVAFIKDLPYVSILTSSPAFILPLCYHSTNSPLKGFSNLN